MKIGGFDFEWNQQTMIIIGIIVFILFMIIMIFQSTVGRLFGGIMGSLPGA